MISYQRSMGSWLVTIIERASYRSSTISSKSRRWSASRGSGPQSSRISRSSRAIARSILASIPSIGAAECESGEQTRDTMVGNGEVIPASLVAERASKPTFAEPGQTNGIMPGVRRLKCGSPIRSTRAVANWCRLSDANAMEALIISSFVSPTPPWRFCLPG